jgi:hypothetical protein
MAFADVVTSQPMTYAILTISLKDGETIDYVSAQACDRDALLEAIEHACPEAALTRTHARQDSMPLALPRLGGFLNVIRS